MKRLAWRKLGVLSVLSIAIASPFLIRGAWRYRELDRVLSLRGARHRVDIEPREEALDAAVPGTVVDIGYANFDIDDAEPLSIQVTGSLKTALRLQNDEVEMLIPAPFSTNGAVATPLPAESGENHLAGRIRQSIADHISEEEAVERTRELPFSRLMLMSRDEFLAYALDVTDKASNRMGSHDVVFFTSQYCRGIIRVGEDSQDVRHAHIVIASTDGSKCVGIHLWLSSTSTRDIQAVLNPIIASFRFTVESVNDQKRIRSLIAEKVHSANGDLPFERPSTEP
jgi:hypothetical protein